MDWGSVLCIRLTEITFFPTLLSTSAIIIPNLSYTLLSGASSNRLSEGIPEKGYSWEFLVGVRICIPVLQIQT